MEPLTTNVGRPERLLSVIGGGYLLYNAIAERKAGVYQTLAGSYLLLRGFTGFCPLYRAAGKTEVDFRTQNINIKAALTINRPREQVYAFWRRLENLPLFMKHLKRVEVIDEKTSEWKAVVPGEWGAITWRSEIVKDDPGSTLSWHSLPGSAIENAGKITFSDAGRFGTEIHVVISYHAPLGLLGEKTIRLFNPVFEDIVKEDVRNFKRYMETGEIPTIEGQSSGRNKKSTKNRRLRQNQRSV
jgi:uncharacterized membrane protein